MAKDRVFPEITSSIWFTVAYSLLMFSVLWYLSSGRTQAADPLYMYLILGSWLIVLGANQANFGELRKLAGFKPPYPGYNALLAVFGIGVGGLVYALLTHSALTIFQGNEYALSLFRPLYTPLSLPQFSISLGLAGAGTYIFYIYVGIFEELQKVFTWKNMVNYISSKGISLTISSLVAFLLANLIWALMHWFAWGGLTLGSIFFALAFGTIFWLTYFIPDITGLLSPKEPVKWTGVLLTGSVTSHATWDILVEEGLLLPFNQFVLASVLLTVIPLLGMWFVRGRYEGQAGLIPVEDMRN